MSLEQPRPGVDRAWHGDRVDAVVEGGHAQLGHLVGAGTGGRAARAVQRHHLGTRAPEQHEAVAANAGHARLDHAMHRHRGHRGIDRIAAAT